MTEKDLVHHYKVLKQFLDISDDLALRSKTNSTRAARAREKLLKLSEAQFKELSTDVYDELRRRIDESRGEPDYLLPKSSFHPKRNQARQKLSSLPQLRFKDLVSDISYEIERRNLHTEYLEDSNTRRLDGEHAGPATDHESDRLELNDKNHSSPDKKVNGSHSRNPNEQNTDFKNQTIGVQSKTVVPEKANLTWSSDDDDEEEEEDEENGKGADSKNKAKNSLPYSLDSDENDKVIADLKVQLDTLRSEKEELERKTSSLQDDYQNLVKQNRALSEELDVLSDEKQKYQIKKSDSMVSNNKLLEDFEAQKAANAALRLEIQSLKNSTSRRNTSLRELNSSSGSIHYNNTPNNQAKNLGLTAPAHDVRKEMELVLEKLSDLNISRQPVEENSILDLKHEITKWQSKYEEARSNQISRAFSTEMVRPGKLGEYISLSGLISIRLISDFHSLVESFMINLDATLINCDLLFEKIAKLSVLINEIAEQGDNKILNSNEHSVNLRESTTYALTAVRYFASFDVILPKVVVERSIGEICFSLCELISASKLNENSYNSRRVESDEVKLSKPATSVADNFDARPLRMANRLRQQQTQSQDDLVGFSSPKENGNGNTAPPLNSETIAGGQSNLKLNDDSSRFNINEEDIKKERDLAPVIDDRGNTAGSLKSTNADNLSFDRSIPENPNRSGTLGQTPASSSIAAISSKDITGSDDGLLSTSGTPEKKSISKTESKLASPKDSSPGRSTLSKNILDRVKQFESPDNDKVDGSKIVNENILNSGSLPVRNKSFFQSLRDKLSTDNDEQNVSHKGLNSVMSTEQEEPTGLTEQSRNVEAKETNGSRLDVNDQDSIDEVSFINRDSSNKAPTGESEPIGSYNKIETEKIEEENLSDSTGEIYSEDENNSEEKKARHRQEQRKSVAAATFNIDLFDIDDPDNTLTQVLLYLEHQTVQVITTIQSLLSAIKKPNATRGDLRDKSQAITVVISQMTEATNTSMNQTRNSQLKEHGSWVVKSLEDCNHRMNILCKPNSQKNDTDFADKNFKQRLAGISFDIAKCTKELVKTVEEASIKEDIAHLDARLNHQDDLT
ncbi:uncharacterized protein PRCAT00001162001 [Priceomyces carsonii]|uniref:uncharacterized protein n=1 Tax=Priceomyces carsonii TaxID=28549 RepID=UPI002EDBA372|nr:unnamed protein product [Priceomyces carsonii]